MPKDQATENQVQSPDQEPHTPTQISYKDSGVDIAAGDALVDWLRGQPPQVTPFSGNLLSGIGGFAALFRADFPGLQRPCLVSCTDGVGTKVKLAVEFARYREVAQDMVAMSINDLICSGARPLFFLDYYACGQLRLEAAKEFLSGVREACAESDCLLIGGETAEMPGVYQGQDFDCAGFALGVVDEAEILGAHRVQEGDLLLGLASNGFHSNGYSLLRKLFAGDMKDWADCLLRPTALYSRVVDQMLKRGGVRALAHITGGGMDNLLRVMPDSAVVELNSWPMPEEFVEVKRRSGLSWQDMLKTLNCGVGLVAVVAKEQLSDLQEVAESCGHKAFPLGEVRSRGAKAKARWELARSWEDEL